MNVPCPMTLYQTYTQLMLEREIQGLTRHMHANDHVVQDIRLQSLKRRNGVHPSWTEKGYPEDCLNAKPLDN